MELKTVEVEETSEEGVNGESQTPKKMGYENHPLTGARLGNPDRIETRQPFDDGRAGQGDLGHRKVPDVLQRGDVLLGDGGTPP